MKRLKGWMFNYLALCLALLVARSVGQNLSSNPVELADETHYKLLLKNESVRVWLLELKPQQQTARHAHRFDFLQVSLNDARIGSTGGMKESAGFIATAYGQGEMWYGGGGFAHALRNESATDTARQIEIELLLRGPSKNYLRDIYDDYSQPKYLPPPVDPNGNYNDKGIIYNVGITHQQILSGASGEIQEHKSGHLVLALTDLELKDEIEGKPAGSVKMKLGEARWYDGGMRHKLTNVGSHPAQFITVEFR